MKKYFINTYGCQMNVHESEKIAGILRNRGYEEAFDNQSADIIILNTCCVRETAETKVLGNLGIIKKIKEQKPNLIVGICGCMPQKPGTAQMLKKRCPFIDIIFGTHNIYELSNYLDEVENGRKILDIWESEGDIKEDIPIYRTSGINAWLNIMYGCNNFCSYCIVPYVRGRERSRDFYTIVKQIKELINQGYKEITLLGQNVNSYGNDLADKDKNFAALLSEIAGIDGSFKLKFMTSHPKDISEEVVKVIASSDNMAKYIHLPVQAGSNRILELMNRKYTAEQYLEKIEMIRDYIPNIGLSSDLMVGFPTETDSDFADSLRLIEKVRYNNLYTFIYSRRSGTPADKMDGQIELATKKQRIDQLIKKQFEIGCSIAQECVGKTYRVLVDEQNGNQCNGKSDCEKSISFISEENLLGQFVNITVTACKNNKLLGEM